MTESALHRCSVADTTCVVTSDGDIIVYMCTVTVSGPCPPGVVVVQDPATEELACDCGPHLTSNYWPATRRCYPLYSEGPCQPGEQFR